MKPIYYFDAGHGGHDSGAVNSDTGTAEKDIALRVCSLMVNRLKQDGRIEARMTREDDSFLSLGRRAAIANETTGSTLFSVHCNAGGGFGYECFTSPGQSRSDPLATSCLDRYGERFPGRRLRADVRDGDPDKEARFAVLTRTRGRALLFELGFIDTAGGEAFLSNEANQEAMAEALVEGILLHEFGSIENPNGEAPPDDGEAPSTELELVTAQRDRLANLLRELNARMGKWVTDAGRVESEATESRAVVWGVLEETGLEK